MMKITVGIIHDNLSQLATDSIEEWLTLFFNKDYQERKQITSEVTFGLNITKQERYISWENSAQNIYNQIRGLNPWPIALANFNNNTFKIISAKIAINNDQNNNFQPGTIINVDENGLLISTGSRENILIKMIVWPYKPKMSIKEFIKGNPLFKINQILN